ncbi:ABC transporter permease, partial [Rhizobium ruizarguesonis]
MTTKAAEGAAPLATRQMRRRIPTELSIFLVLVGIALISEVLGWMFI